MHEYAHAWMAYRLGDPTAKIKGRLTLNPLKHIDPVGSVIVPIMFRLIGFLPIGWAKPVPVNAMNLRHPKRDMMWIGLAGPFMNIILAVLFSQLLRFELSSSSYSLISTVIILNLVLGLFNLTPIPPLDGSRLVANFLSNRWAYFYRRLEPFGIIIVYFCLQLGLLDLIWIGVGIFANCLGVNLRALL